MTRSYSVLSRIETCNFILETLSQKGKIAITRYSDGEYNLLKSDKFLHLATGNENGFYLKNKLRETMENLEHFMCINELKPKNLKTNDKWVDVQGHLAAVGRRGTYGSANWNIFDFQEENRVLPSFFKGETLILTSFADEAKEVFNKEGIINVNFMQTDPQLMSKKYISYYKDLQKIVKQQRYKNIIFCCGPTGKVLLVEMNKLNKMNKINYVDLGSLLNAIIAGVDSKESRLIKQWRMSWVKTTDIEKLAKEFIKKVKGK